MMREAVNDKTMKDIISIQPKIIHLSCHGAKDDSNKESFNLFLEEIGTGHDYKFSQKKLKALLDIKEDQKKPIKLVFVSACFSY